MIVTPHTRAEAEPLLAQLRRTFLPNRVLAVVSAGQDLSAQVKVLPIVQDRVVRQGKATAYVCERNICKFPTTDPQAFARQLR